MNNELKKQFQMHCKHFFLTYPARDGLSQISKKEMVEYFKVKCKEIKARIKEIVVSFETGEKEQDSKDYEHWHVLISFDRQVRVRDAEFFDVRGVHGHYKAVSKVRGSLRRVREYCMKDDDYEKWECP